MSTTTISYGSDNNNTPVDYEDGNISLGDNKKRIDVNRGRLSFAGNLGDNNHCIYNNAYNLDDSEAWDGMKINCYKGLEVRTGGNGNTLQFKVDEAEIRAFLPLRANRFEGAFKVGDVTSPASHELAGTLRYVESDHGSVLEICMKNNDGNYEWKEILEN